MSLFISSVFTYDEDAGNYIQAVETADAQALEPATRKAINNFVIGCKQDGIWTAIKASCILAGARTLAGALQPLVGTGPNRFGTEGGWSYNRETGLAGNGTDNYLDSNRNNNADPQNSKHISAYLSTTGTGLIMGARSQTGGTTFDLGGAGFRCRLNTIQASDDLTLSPAPTGYMGGSRNGASSTVYRHSALTIMGTSSSETPQTESILIMARRNPSTGLPEGFGTRRLAFYSIGESLDLARLDARVTDLINAFAVTIP